MIFTRILDFWVKRDCPNLPWFNVKKINLSFPFCYNTKRWRTKETRLNIRRSCFPKLKARKKFSLNMKKNRRSPNKSVNWWTIRASASEWWQSNLKKYLSYFLTKFKWTPKRTIFTTTIARYSKWLMSWEIGSITQKRNCKSFRWSKET